MAVTFANRARMSTATTGTGTITLGTASTGYMSFAEAGIANGNTVSYCIEDGNNFEVGHGVYSSAGATMTRSVIASKINGQAADTTPISLSGSAIVFATLLAEDIVSVPTASIDNVVPRFDGTEGALQNSGVTLDDSNVLSGAKVLATGGTTARLMSSRAADEINVLDYGADPTGVSDSYAAFAAAGAAYTAGNKGFYCPDGTYLLSQGVAFDLNSSWNTPRLPPPALRFGTQALLKATATISGGLFRWGSNSGTFNGLIRRGVMSGGIFDANNLADFGLHIPFAQNVTVFGVQARNGAMHHFKFGDPASPDTSYEILMDQCKTHRFTPQANITGITKANPGVVTVSGTHPYVNGQTVTLASVGGMVEVNNRQFTIANVTASTFSINQNTTGYTTYTSGGVVQGGFSPTGSACVYWEGVGDSHMSNCVLNGAQYGLTHSGTGIYDAKIHNCHVWNFTANGKTVRGFDVSGSNELIGCQVDGPWEDTGAAYYFDQDLNNLHGCNVTYEGVTNQSSDNAAYPVRIASGTGGAHAFGCNWKALSASFRLAAEAVGDIARWASYGCTSQNMVIEPGGIFHRRSLNGSFEFTRQNSNAGASASITDRMVTDAGTMFHIVNSTAGGANGVIDWTGNGGLFIECGNTGSSLNFQTDYVTRLKILPTTGIMVAGHSASVTMAGNIAPILQAHAGNTGGSSYSGVRWSADAGAPQFTFGKSRNASIGSHTVVQSGDSLGAIRWDGSDGDEFIRGAQIEAFVDGTPGNNDMPTRLSFSTTLDGASSATERLRISNAGAVTALTATGGLGYGTGAGSTVTQATSRTTGVTINTVCGQITLVSAAGSTTYASFTVTNSTVAATDSIRVVQASGTDLYEIHVTAVAAGSFRITFRTTAGTTVEQPVFNFAVIKAVAA